MTLLQTTEEPTQSSCRCCLSSTYCLPSTVPGSGDSGVSKLVWVFSELVWFTSKLGMGVDLQSTGKARHEQSNHTRSVQTAVSALWVSGRQQDILPGT